MTELTKVFEDMAAGQSLRRKLYYVSPLLTALLFSLYERIGIRTIRVFSKALMGRGPVDLTPEFERKTAERLKALRLEKLEVLSGPFKGMAYGDFAHGSPIMPKLLGTYESELHTWIADAIFRDYDCIINVGSAEGYYAVGFAYTKPLIEVFAFDTAKATDSMVPKLAALNAVQNRVHKSGACSPHQLQDLLSKFRKPLLFIDIEGFEDELLDIKKAPSLRFADIIVETHDCFNLGVTQRLIQRLWPTHKFEIRAGQEDEDRPIPIFVSERIADPALARTFVSEFRGIPELWLRFRTRAIEE